MAETFKGIRKLLMPKPKITDTRDILAKYFQLDSDVFNSIPRVDRITWVKEIRQVGYKLTHQQYNFLIGRGWYCLGL